MAARAGDYVSEAAPGIEPGTSRSLSENHATRPSSRIMTRNQDRRQRSSRSMPKKSKMPNVGDDRALRLQRLVSVLCLRLFVFWDCLARAAL